MERNLQEQFGAKRVLNIERIRGSLRWTPQVTLAEGLRRTAEWFARREVSAQGPVAPPCLTSPHGTSSPPAVSPPCS